MAWVCRSDRRNPARMLAMRQPVRNLRPDRPTPLATPAIAIPGTRLAGDQQHKPRALRHGKGQHVIEPTVRGIE